MKKKATGALMAAVMAAVTLAGCSTLAAAETTAETTVSETAVEAEVAEGHVQNVKGVSEIGNVFHQISAVIVDYGVEVTAPDPDAYHIVDYECADLREDSDRRDSSEGVITAVYANNEPKRLDDPSQASPEGRYVVIELELTKDVEYVSENAFGENCSYRPTTATGIITRRLTGDKSDWRRTDFSQFVVNQTETVASADGTVLFPAEQLPTILNEEMTNLELDEFVTTSLESSRGTPIHYSYYHPDEQDSSKKYPMMISVTGGGGKLDFDEEGNPISIGGNTSRDRMAVEWLNAGEEMIVVSVQLARDNAPYIDQYDDVEDTAELIQYFIDHYHADPDRVYCMGSSAGTLHLSQFLQKHADMIAAYVQCNGHFEGAQTMYTEEGDQNFVDYTDTSLLNPDPESYLPEAREALKGVLENHIPIWIWHGINDETAPVTRGVSTCEILKTLYKEQGLEDDAIAELAKIYLIEDDEFYSYGVVERHSASKIALKHPEMKEWVLEQSRIKNAAYAD